MKWFNFLSINSKRFLSRILNLGKIFAAPERLRSVVRAVRAAVESLRDSKALKDVEAFSDVKALRNVSSLSKAFSSPIILVKWRGGGPP